MTNEDVNSIATEWLRTLKSDPLAQLPPIVANYLLRRGFIHSLHADRYELTLEGQKTLKRLGRLRIVKSES